MVAFQMTVSYVEVGSHTDDFVVEGGSHTDDCVVEGGSHTDDFVVDTVVPALQLTVS